MPEPAPSDDTIRFGTRWSRGPYALPGLVGLALALATLAAWLWETDRIAEQRLATYRNEAAAITAEIGDRLRLHAQFLRSLRGFAASTAPLEPTAWRRFADSIDIRRNLPGLIAIAYAPAVPNAARTTFVAEMRRHPEQQGFAIFPLSDAPLSTPVIAIYPEAPPVQAAIGFDLYSEVRRRTAIDRSFAEKDVAITAPLVLFFDRDTERKGFLLIDTISAEPPAGKTGASNRLAGVVLAAYRADEFIEAALHDVAPHFALTIFDSASSGAAGNSSAPLYVSRHAAPSSDNEMPIGTEIDFGGRIWRLEFTPLPLASPHLATPEAPILILIGGFSTSLLLAALIFQLRTREARAVRYAEEVTVELVEHRAHLEDLVAQRTEQLNIALQDAQSANVAKSEFLANMSHELRTPMHAILSFSELGRSRATDQPKLMLYFQRIETSAQRLLRLINDLLSLSKLEAGSVELRHDKLDIAALIENAASQLESLLQERRLQLDVVNSARNATLVGDGERLTQVVVNLLSNAIRYSPEGEKIGIEIEQGQLPTGRRESDQGRRPALVFRVIDRGIGIPGDELHSIFDKFVQSSATKTNAGGTGLGLAIARSIVLQHHGRIEAANNEGGGACFTVTLPLDPHTGTIE